MRVETLDLRISAPSFAPGTFSSQIQELRTCRSADRLTQQAHCRGTAFTMARIPVFTASGRLSQAATTIQRSSGSAWGTHRAHFWCKEMSCGCSGSAGFCSGAGETACGNALMCLAFAQICAVSMWEVWAVSHVRSLVRFPPPPLSQNNTRTTDPPQNSDQ